MLPKSRMIAAVEHREPDRVPVGEIGADWEITDRALGVRTLYRAGWRGYTALWEGRREEIVESHVRDLIGLARKFEWDFVVVPMMPPRRGSFRKPEMLSDYSWRDDRGRVWRYSPDGGSHATVVESPSMTIEQLPDPETPIQVDSSRFEAVERVVKELGKTHMVFVRVPDATFPWEGVLGMDGYLERMVTEPEFIRKAVAFYTKRSIAYIEAAAAVGVDGVQAGNDYCDNRGPLMSPRLFRELELPGLVATVEAAHRKGLYFLEHSDGNTWRILDDLIGAGIDGWQGIEPRIGMDLKLLKEKYGEKVTFFGGVDCDTLVAGSQEQVEAEVSYAIRHAGRGGGLVLCSGNTLMPGTKYENYEAMLSAARKYGLYPIEG